MIQNGTNPCDGIIGTKCNICLFSKSILTGFTSIFNGQVVKKKNLIITIESKGRRNLSEFSITDQL